MAQGLLIGLDLTQAPAGFGQFLSGHAAMLVEFDRLVRHRPLPFSGIPGFGCPNLAIPATGVAVEPVRSARRSRPRPNHQMEPSISQFNAGPRHCCLF